MYCTEIRTRELPSTLGTQCPNKNTPQEKCNSHMMFCFENSPHSNHAPRQDAFVSSFARGDGRKESHRDSHINDWLSAAVMGTTRPRAASRDANGGSATGASSSSTDGSSHVSTPALTLDRVIGQVGALLMSVLVEWSWWCVHRGR